jgi:hypothetical protein
MQVATRREATRRRALAHIEENTKRMEADARAKLRAVAATARTRKAIEAAHARYVRGRDGLLRRKFTSEQERFLRLMIADYLIRQPELHEKLGLLVRMLADNYGWEWCRCEFTRRARDEGRELILTSAESAFGDTPMAGPLALVRYHHEMLRIRDVSDYGEMYARAAALMSDRFFQDAGRPYREQLGIHFED